MEFSLPYLKNTDVFFYVFKGKEQGFDPSNVVGKKIGKQFIRLSCSSSCSSSNSSSLYHMFIDFNVGAMKLFSCFP